MKILLAVDGSPYTKKMLAYLAVHDQLLSPDSQYTALTIRTACLCIDPTLIFLETSRLRTYRSCSVSPT